MNIETILKHAGSLCSDFGTSVICACLLVFISTGAAEFCKSCKTDLQQEGLPI